MVEWTRNRRRLQRLVRPSGAARLSFVRLPICLENRIDARLVPFAESPEPVQYVAIDSQRELSLAANRLEPSAHQPFRKSRRIDLGNVRSIDVAIGHCL